MTAKQMTSEVVLVHQISTALGGGALEWRGKRMSHGFRARRGTLLSACAV
jgi:hypothetical protein